MGPRREVHQAVPSIVDQKVVAHGIVDQKVVVRGIADQRVVVHDIADQRRGALGIADQKVEVLQQAQGVADQKLVVRREVHVVVDQRQAAPGTVVLHTAASRVLPGTARVLPGTAGRRRAALQLLHAAQMLAATLDHTNRERAPQGAITAGRQQGALLVTPPAPRGVAQPVRLAVVTGLPEAARSGVQEEAGGVVERVVPQVVHKVVQPGVEEGVVEAATQEVTLAATCPKVSTLQKQNFR